MDLTEGRRTSAFSFSVHYPEHTHRGNPVDFDFTNDTIEKLIVKRILTDRKYLGKRAKSFDARLFDSKPLGTIAKLAVVFYRKYDKVPTNREMSALVKKYCESRDDVKEADVSSSMLEVSNLGIDYTSKAAVENCEKYVRGKMYYLTICDTANEVIRTGHVDKCLERFDEIEKSMFDDERLGLGYFSDEGMKSHWDYIMNPDAKISTGWIGLDSVTNGGFLRDGRMLACFMGQAGLGKSLFLSNITVNFLCQNLSVVVISLEMSENVYSSRFDAHISKININRLKENCDTAISRIKAFHDEHPDAMLTVKEYPPRSVKCADIEAYLDNLKAANVRFDAIVVDYLNLILPNNKTDSMYSGIMEVVEKLRTLSYKFNVPVITATQANRQGMNNENISMEHVSESGGIAHTVDFLGGLYQMDEDREHGIINMRVIKNRLGGSVGKVIPFSMNPENLVLKDRTGDPIGSGEESEADSIVSNLANISADMNDDL